MHFAGTWQYFQISWCSFCNVQIRALGFLIGVVKGVLEAMAGLEGALAAAMRKPGKAALKPSSTRPSDVQPSHPKHVPAHPTAGHDGADMAAAKKLGAIEQDDMLDVEAPSPKQLSFVDDHEHGTVGKGNAGHMPALVPAKPPKSSGRQKSKRPSRPLALLMYCIGFLKLPLLVSRCSVKHASLACSYKACTRTGGSLM